MSIQRGIGAALFYTPLAFIFLVMLALTIFLFANGQYGAGTLVGVPVMMILGRNLMKAEKD